MARYAALLRGVSPMNCKMPELKNALQSAGFTDVKTVISSGNAVFTTRKASEQSLQNKCEAALRVHMGRSFLTIVRSIDDLEEMLVSDPYRRIELPAGAKRDVTFLRAMPRLKPKLPVDLRGAQICTLKDRIAFSFHVPQQTDPAFMVLIEKTFGKEVTTRTWETVERIVKAATAL
ncbi:MAG: DUF1697 domain-containing protein [Gemmatimonadota bacterium]